MTTANILLIDLLVTAAAIRGGQTNAGNYKSMMIFLVLARRGLVALQTIHAFLGVLAHFIFMHYGILQARVTLRAFARSPHEIRSSLFGFKARTRAVNEKCAEDEGKGNYNRDED